LIHALPGPCLAATLTAATHLAKPESRNRGVELGKTLEIVRDGMVTLPTPNHAGEPTTCLTDRRVPAANKLLLDHRERATHAAGHRDTLERESLGPPGLPADVREAKKVKRLTLTSALALSLGGALAAKLNQASFLRVKVKAEAFETRRERLQAGSGIRFMFEAYHEVVRVTDHYTFACRMSLSPLVDPQIKHVVQEYIR